MSLKYEYVTSTKRAEEVCKILLNSNSVCSDTEGTGSDPHKDKTTLISFSTKKDGTFVVDTRNENNLKAFEQLLDNEKVIKVLHGSIYDYKMILGTANVETENIMDTLLGERILTAGKQFSGYGYADIMKKYLGIEIDKTLQTSFINHTGEFSKAQLDYAALDVFHMPDLVDKMYEQIKSDGLTKTWKIESGAVQSFGDMEFYGQKIIKEKWIDNIKANQAKALEAKEELDSFFRAVCDYDLEGNLCINYDSPTEVLLKLRQMGVTVDGSLISGTNKKIQNKIKEHPVMRALSRYRNATHRIDQFGIKYTDAINPITGRVHFAFNQMGADTGRPSTYGGLNCLNIPREDSYRECFGTDSDRLISTCDWNGMELRILADLSRDPIMIRAFLNDEDLHCVAASIIFGVLVTKTNENSRLRIPGKEINFGIAYGMGPGTLYEKLNAAGYKITLEECKSLYYRYVEKFSVAMNWLKSRQKEASRKFMMTNRNGRRRYWFKPNEENLADKISSKDSNLSERQVLDMVASKRKAHLAAIEREGANFEIQSMNADIAKTSLAECRKQFKKLGWGAKEKKGSRTYNFIYDEILYDFHKDFAEQGHSIQKKIMEECGNSMLATVKMKVDGSLGDFWSK